jgi:DNA-binding NtrC family response regulator
MSPPKILVVDDESSVRTMFETKFHKQIRNKELAFVFAYNGEEALKIIEESSPVDVIFTDLNMPRMDGITFLKHLTTDNGHIPAIVITAYGDYDRLLEAINSGASGFLGKPINLGDLEHTITRCLRQQEKMKRRIESLECELLQAKAKVLELQAKNQELEQKLISAYTTIEALEAH